MHVSVSSDVANTSTMKGCTCVGRRHCTTIESDDSAQPLLKSGVEVNVEELRRRRAVLDRDIHAGRSVERGVEAPR